MISVTVLCHINIISFIVYIKLMKRHSFSEYPAIPPEISANQSIAENKNTDGKYNFGDISFFGFAK